MNLLPSLMSRKSHTILRTTYYCTHFRGVRGVLGVRRAVVGVRRRTRAGGGFPKESRGVLLVGAADVRRFALRPLRAHDASRGVDRRCEGDRRLHARNAPRGVDRRCEGGRRHCGHCVTKGFVSNYKMKCT